MTPKLLNRINELAKKKREIGLTDEEAIEQKKLYKEYLQQFKNNFKTQLNNIDVKTPDGNVKPLSDYKKN